jgi:hypothetical protein
VSLCSRMKNGLINQIERDLRVKEEMWTRLCYMQPVATTCEHCGQGGRDVKHYGQ